VLAGDAFTQQNVVIAGRTVPLVPRHKIGLRTSWDFTPATRLSVLARYVSSQFMDNDEGNTLGTKIPPYKVVDMKLTHRRGPLTIAATVNNLFGEIVLQLRRAQSVRAGSLQRLPAAGTKRIRHSRVCVAVAELGFHDNPFVEAPDNAVQG
jgi:outer membrane receptor protein involved in Fe transport